MAQAPSMNLAWARVDQLVHLHARPLPRGWIRR